MKYPLIILCFLLGSCVGDVEISLPERDREIAFNCLLNPDNDTIIAQITWSKLITDQNNFNSVKEISVSLFEEGEFAGHFLQSDSTHFYLAYQVKPGKKYRIEASTGTKKSLG